MGLELDFETDKNFNYDSNISMKIELKKTCFSKGELVQGNLYLAPKTPSVSSILINPLAEITLREHHYYVIKQTVRNKVITVKQEENVVLVNENIYFAHNEFNISNGCLIPFEIKIPDIAYPSCIFDPKCYVRHYLGITFPSIFAKKTVVIIIKNNIYFSDINGLLKSPVIINREITKHKYIFFNSGDFKISIVLSKNIFSYNENVPFIIDIDCNYLSIKIQGIKVILYREYKKNVQNSHEVNKRIDTEELIQKYISLIDVEKNLHIEDNIKLPISPPELNPKVIYSILDNDHRRHKEKFKNILLFPACYGGLLTCEYFIQFIFDLDSWFTTNEDFTIPIDFGELNNELISTLKKFELNPYITNNNKTQINNMNNDDIFPDENEIYQKKTSDDDAPPPNTG